MFIRKAELRIWITSAENFLNVVIGILDGLRMFEIISTSYSQRNENRPTHTVWNKKNPSVTKTKNTQKIKQMKKTLKILNPFLLFPQILRRRLWLTHI